MLRAIAVAGLAGIMLTGCLGLDDGGDSPEDPGNPALTDNEECQTVADLKSDYRRAVGYYTGKLVQDGTAFDTIAFVGADGQFVAAGGPRLAYGEIEGGQESLTGTGIFFDSSGGEKLKLTGSFQPLQKVNVADEDELAFALDLEYFTPRFQHCMETGNYASSYSDAAYGFSATTTLTISETGQVDGSIGSGCIIAGQIKSYGVVGGNFSLAFEMSGCPAESGNQNGTYSGQGKFLFSSDGVGGGLIFLAHSENAYIVRALQR